MTNALLTFSFNIEHSYIQFVQAHYTERNNFMFVSIAILF